MSTYALTPEEIEAMDASIRHWEENLERAQKEITLLIGHLACSCCCKWRRWKTTSSALVRELSCEGCPIARASGYPVCANTPYREGYWDADIDYCQEMIGYLLRVRAGEDLSELDYVKEKP